MPYGNIMIRRCKNYLWLILYCILESLHNTLLMMSKNCLTLDCLWNVVWWQRQWLCSIWVMIDLFIQVVLYFDYTPHTNPCYLIGGTWLISSINLLCIYCCKAPNFNCPQIVVPHPFDLNEARSFAIGIRLVSLWSQYSSLLYKTKRFSLKRKFFLGFAKHSLGFPCPFCVCCELFSND